MLLIVLFVCFAASIIGAICGIGGGVIIKPVLDAFGVFSVPANSFLSGCTVLSMTTYSVIKSNLDGESKFDQKKGIPLSIGAAFGGIVGKWIFSYIAFLSLDKNRVGAVQAACLLIVTIGALVYTVFRKKIRTYTIRAASACMLIGLFLGLLSSFLGIGGGPVNLVVLFYFFSMPTKMAAENSIYIIFFSQITSLISSLVTRSLPVFSFEILVFMVIGGIAGGICGRVINQKIEERTVDKLFVSFMVFLIFINLYNMWKFLV